MPTQLRRDTEKRKQAQTICSVYCGFLSRSVGFRCRGHVCFAPRFVGWFEDFPASVSPIKLISLICSCTEISAILLSLKTGTRLTQTRQMPEGYPKVAAPSQTAKMSTGTFIHSLESVLASTLSSYPVQTSGPISLLPPRVRGFSARRFRCRPCHSGATHPAGRRSKHESPPVITQLNDMWR